jgi:hypothetical protein
MTTETTVRRFRISAIWPAFTPVVLERAPSSETFDGKNPLSGPIAYRNLVKTLLSGEGELPPPWQVARLPWDAKSDERFWLEYSTQQPDEVPDRLVPAAAAKHLVPLHVRGSAPERPPWKLSFHHFVYPFGIASLLHAEYPHPEPAQRGERDVAMPLGDVVEACYDLRGDGSRGSSWDEWVAGSVGPAAALLGDPELHNKTPLTVVTFVEVDDVLSLADAQRDRVLNALTGWPERPKWSQAAIDRLDVKLAPRRAIEGRVVHAARRGRTFWFPDGFVGGATLSEDHRRFCFTTMQTEMLVRFMAETAPRLDALPPAWEDWAKKAARTIGLLYADDQLAAWDSTSPRVQVDSSGEAGAINLVRERFGLPSLH